MILDDIKIKPLYSSAKIIDIDDKEYFSSKYRHYISNSRLSLLNPKQGGSPEKFFSKIPPIYSDSILLGSAVHEIILQPYKFFLAENIDRPSAKLGFLCDELYKYYKNRTGITDDIITMEAHKVDYYSNNLNEAKKNNAIRTGLIYWTNREKIEQKYKTKKKQPIFLDYRNRQKALMCQATFDMHLKDKLTVPDMLQGGNERTVLLDCLMLMPNKKKYIFHLKGKIDNYIVTKDSIIVNDLKTVGNINLFEGNIQKYRYMREMAIYCWLLGCALHEDKINRNYQSSFLIVSTTSSDWKIVPMTRGMFREGWHEFKNLLKLAAYYYDKGCKFE